MFFNITNFINFKKSNFMKKLFSYLCVGLFLTFTSCNEEAIDTQPTTSLAEDGGNVNSANRLSSSFENVIEIGDKQFVPQRDHSVAYYLNDIYQHNISLEDPDYNVIDNSETTGEVTFVNNNSEIYESLTIKNLRDFEDFVIFDIELSTGEIINDVRMSNVSRGVPIGGIWGIIIGAAVEAIVSSIFDTNDDGGISQSECRKALQSISCGSGGKPYYNYTPGNWFTAPRCSVGCR